MIKCYLIGCGLHGYSRVSLHFLKQECTQDLVEWEGGASNIGVRF